ncbi:MAG: type IX secretion system membrane protein PorP/SprF [Cyclobacteriaceae bacterium]
MRPDVRVLTTLIFITSLSLKAQQDALFSQYMFNEIFYNPAVAGLDNTTYLAAAHRSQWAGYSSSFDGNNGAPSTQLLSFVMPLTKGINGVGLNLVRDKLGAVSNFEAQISVSYKKDLPFGSLSFGLRPSIFNHSIDFNQFRAVDDGDPLLTSSSKESQIQPDLGAGVFLSAKNFFGGISVNHLLNPGFDFGIDGLQNKLETSLNAYAGYNYSANNDLILTPSVFVRSEFNTLSFDLSLLGTYKEIMWGGLSYRQEEAIVMMIGYSFLEDKSLRAVYSFDLVVQSQEAKQPTSHEISVRKILSFSPPGPPKAVRTPRFRFD